MHLQQISIDSAFLLDKKSGRCISAPLKKHIILLRISSTILKAMIQRTVNLFHRELSHFEGVLEILHGKRWIIRDKKVVIIRIFQKEEKEKWNKSRLLLFRSVFLINGRKDRDGDCWAAPCKKKYDH